MLLLQNQSHKTHFLPSVEHVTHLILRRYTDLKQLLPDSDVNVALFQCTASFSSRDVSLHGKSKETGAVILYRVHKAQMYEDINGLRRGAQGGKVSKRPVSPYSCKIPCFLFFFLVQHKVSADDTQTLNNFLEIKHRSPSHFREKKFTNQSFG